VGNLVACVCFMVFLGALMAAAMHWWDTHWLQAVATLVIALLVSWVALCGRYQHQGLPFGSRAAAARALMVIAATALVTTALAEALPYFPISLAVVIPALLCANRLSKGERELHVTEHQQWLWLMTLGVGRLLEVLERQMEDDRENWCDRRMDQIHGLDDLEVASWHVYSALIRRNRDAALRRKLKSDYDATSPAISSAREAMRLRQDELARKETHTAEEAVRMMLIRAYDWGYTSISVLPAPGQRRERGDPPALTSQRD
jgi:hypothetical protein